MDLPFPADSGSFCYNATAVDPSDIACNVDIIARYCHVYFGCDLPTGHTFAHSHHIRLVVAQFYSDVRRNLIVTTHFRSNSCCHCISRNTRHFYIVLSEYRRITSKSKYVHQESRRFNCITIKCWHARSWLRKVHCSCKLFRCE